jgi:hypothetical protein
MAEDSSTKMVINDVGNGWQHHWLIGKNHLLDMDFKLNEEFSFFHPILLEDVTVRNKQVVRQKDRLKDMTDRETERHLK